MRDRSDLASCAVFCCHCGIRFLTHPRNANGRDLFCPFGCREHRRRQQANERSKKHYRTDRGRRNKKLLNGKRSAAYRGAGNESSPVAPPPETPAADDAISSSGTSSAVKAASRRSPDPTYPPTQPAIEDAGGRDGQLKLEGFTLGEAMVVNSPMLRYLAMLASVIEGRSIGAEELLYVLRGSMRQRRFDWLPRREYILRFLNQHPP